MATTQTHDLLHQLRCGKPDDETLAILEDTPADEFIAGLRASYPVVFQERSIGRKHEIGVARCLRFELVASKVSGSLFQSVHLAPILWKCMFVSSYGNALSEVTTTGSIEVRPAWGEANEVLLKMGHGFKLDKTPDGWAVKSLNRRSAGLSEKFLQKRGWNFNALLPFLVRS